MNKKSNRKRIMVQRTLLLLGLLLCLLLPAAAQVNIVPYSYSDGFVGTPYTGTTPTAQGGTPPYTWSINPTPGPLPPGLSINPSTGVVSGTPTQEVDAMFVIVATDAQGLSGTYLTGIRIILAPTIQPPTIPAATQGQSYQQVFYVLGGVQPSFMSVTGGPIPGMTFTPGSDPQLGETLTLTGTPTTAGSYPFTINGVDDLGLQSTRNYTLVVNSPFQISPTTFPNGTVGTVYSQQLSVNTADPVTWQLTGGSLPAGLVLSASNGTISGTPTQAGTSNFTVRANISTGFAVIPVDSSLLSITITNAPLVLQTSSLPDGFVGTAYQQSLTATGGQTPYTYSLFSGNLPAGLTLTSAGTITGTPTAEGTASFVARVTDSDSATNQRALTLRILPVLSVTTAVLESATVNQPYSAQLEHSGTSQAVVWQLVSGSLPPGMTLNTATGMISGTSAQIGNYTFGVQVAVPALQVTSPTRALTISVVLPPLTLNPETLPAGMVGEVYSAAFAPSGGSGTYQLGVLSGTLPPGMQFDAASRMIMGTPTEVGIYTFVMRLTSGAELLEQQFKIEVLPASLRILTASLQDGYRGESYQQSLAADGGVAPYSFRVSAGTLPPAVALNPEGLIVGQPGGSGIFSLTVTVEDAQGVSATKAYTLTVYEPVLLTGPSPLTAATQGEGYSASLVTTGGKAPYSYSRTGGALPAGLTLTAAGTVTGTPEASGVFVFTALVTDANGRTSQRAIELPVVGVMTLEPETLPEGRLLREYNLALIQQGGIGPYRWMVAGDLPPGVLFEGGVFRGAPTSTGTWRFTVSVLDARDRSVSREYSITVTGGVVITTTTLPPAVAGEAYQATLEAGGGRQPYRWAVVGLLPAGLDLDPGLGLIAGSPTAGGTFSFTVRVEDQDGLSDTAALSIVVTMPPPPTLRITNLPSTAPPAQQPAFAVVLDQAYPLPLEGEVDLMFAPDRGPDDPAVQFANGSRRLPFTVPAGQMTANFAAAPPALQTGTVAGLITLVSQYRADGTDVTPTPPPTQTLRINPAAPVLTRLDLVRTATGFELVVFGYSTPRDILRANVRLTPAAGGSLTASEFTIDLNTVFTTWYNSSGSVPFGSQFRLSLPFSLTGNASDIGSASVTLTNSVGTSNTLTTNF
ncbi:MAG: Ig domain-containing protein [Bryobacteraceae bacterium]|nr:putative Ig domain-containing protein [Solibacteraceae bacterium]MCO5351053.1 Ig domain-containing protein [Bryobacteraceae bacterium]